MTTEKELLPTDWKTFIAEIRSENSEGDVSAASIEKLCLMVEQARPSTPKDDMQGIIKGLRMAVSRIQIMRDSQAQAAKHTGGYFAHERLTAYDWAMDNLKHEIDKLEKERGDAVIANNTLDANPDVSSEAGSALRNSALPDDVVRYGDVIHIDYVDAEHIRISREKGSMT